MRSRLRAVGQMAAREEMREKREEIREKRETREAKKQTNNRTKKTNIVASIRPFWQHLGNQKWSLLESKIVTFGHPKWSKMVTFGVPGVALETKKTKKEIDRRNITVPEIHSAGKYKVQVKLHKEVTAEINLEVSSY